MVFNIYNSMISMKKAAVKMLINYEQILFQSNIYIIY